MSTRCVVLVGLMGSGKSEVGQLLAEELGYKFLDVDEAIARASGRPLSQIAAEEGEEAAAGAVSDAVKGLEGSRSRVVAAPSGAPMEPENRRILGSLGLVVYLKASAKELYQRIKNDKSRAIFRVDSPRSEMKRLLDERKDAYTEVSDIVVDTEYLSVDEVVAHLIDELAQRTIETSGEY